MNHQVRHRWPARTSLWLGLLVSGLLPILGACYPYDRESTSDYDVIATKANPDAVFAGKATYAIPDEIVLVTDPDTPPDQAQRINATVESAILEQIDDNMVALGYTKVVDPATADVNLTPFATESNWVSGGCYPYYYDWWYGGYPGWCYPVYYTYTTGTVIVPMFNKTQTAGDEPMWIAAINGIINTDPVTSVAARARSAIDTAFAQSPYLKP